MMLLQRCVKLLCLLSLALTVRAAPPADVPYWSQLDNQYEPLATCSITSMAMITDFFNLTDPEQLNRRTPDYLYERFGKRGDVASLAAVFNTIAQEKGSPLRDKGYVNGTITQLQQLAAAGKPTIIHGWFTASGHILVVTGYDGQNYTVNDPYGQWNGKKFGGYDTSVSGKGLKYSKRNFERVITDNGRGTDLWLHVFE
ncbi:C39 family peptidase [Chitinimonas sp. BJYL2]|uniref:C39 family peptidase n=1 Tax=Chitinimonas sp. BJYL2 TaxID=2976696 RepID=UPI0022B4CD03|nr:C39 family peptidase [Chitinimonas sp. BJYL2]